MKITLFNQYELKISKQYTPLKALLPLGCDCHPAYMLSKLELRKESLPFDWLDTEPHRALQYAYKTIQTKFKYFITDLAKNEQGKVYSRKHPEALFYHFDDLIENQALQKKIDQRVQRFFQVYSHKPCYFIHTLTSDALLQQEDLNNIIKSISDFTSLLKPDDELLLYLRFDESLEENAGNALLLEKAIQSFSQVKLITYIRAKNKFGIWGDETLYRELIESMGVKTRLGLPKIRFVRKRKAKL